MADRQAFSGCNDVDSFSQGPVRHDLTSRRTLLHLDRTSNLARQTHVETNSSPWIDPVVSLRVTRVRVRFQFPSTTVPLGQISSSPTSLPSFDEASNTQHCVIQISYLMHSRKTRLDRSFTVGTPERLLVRFVSVHASQIGSYSLCGSVTRRYRVIVADTSPI
jgi:hypothetical protein